MEHFWRSFQSALFSRGTQTATQTVVQKLKGNCDACRNVTQKGVLVSWTVYYAALINRGAYPGQYKSSVRLLSDPAFCAYFGDKNNFFTVPLPGRPNQNQRDQIEFYSDSGSEMQFWILDEVFAITVN